jgi:hypothetical protein
MAEVRESFGETLAKGIVVVDNQDMRHGISMTKHAP